MVRVKLKEVLKQYRNVHWVEDKDYKQVTISQTGEVSYRGTKHGSSIGRKRQFIINLKDHPNTLIFIRQGVYKGGIGICPPEVDGCIVTENMPMFDIINIKPKYLMNYLKSADFKMQVDKLVPLGTAQKAVHERQLLDIEISLPSEEAQERIIKKLEANSRDISELYSITHLNESYISKLRQAILQDAVQGKLAPQDPNDEPASELLKKIKAEKEKLINEGKIRKEKPLAPITEEEKPYQLPRGWEWVRLEQIKENDNNALKAGPFGSALKKQIYSKKGYKVYGQEQVIKGNPDYGEYYIDSNKFKQLESCSVKPGDILISLVGTVGKVLILPPGIKEGIINPRLVKISLYEEINREYIKLFLYSKIAKDMIKKYFHGSTMDIINLGILKKIYFPLPPLLEQKRIVEKVDKLIAHCDELEKQVKENQENSEKLMNAVLKESFEK
jgi:type I restriction enzyme S subunit